MKIKWQWFLGGRVMFWIAIIVFIGIFFGFTATYLVDPTTMFGMKVQSVDTTSIKEMSEKYVTNLGIKIDRPIIYRFVRYRDSKDIEDLDPKKEVLLGTFHEWNGTYYIDISIDLYKMYSLESIIKHETRHMIVEYLRDEKIIDLTKYTEEIASEKNIHYNYLFEQGVYLLKEFENENK